MTGTRKGQVYLQAKKQALAAALFAGKSIRRFALSEDDLAALFAPLG